MRKLVIGGTAAAALLLAAAAPSAFAHNAGPCNDANEDGMPSGREYAAHHIVFVAHEQGLGAHGHVPGSHHGFSACDPSSL